MMSFTAKYPQLQYCTAYSSFFLRAEVRGSYVSSGWLIGHGQAPLCLQVCRLFFADDKCQAFLALGH